MTSFNDWSSTLLINELNRLSSESASSTTAHESESLLFSKNSRSPAAKSSARIVKSLNSSVDTNTMLIDLSDSVAKANNATKNVKYTSNNTSSIDSMWNKPEFSSEAANKSDNGQEAKVESKEQIELHSKTDDGKDNESIYIIPATDKHKTFSVNTNQQSEAITTDTPVSKKNNTDFSDDEKKSFYDDSIWRAEKAGEKQHNHTKENSNGRLLKISRDNTSGKKSTTIRKKRFIETEYISCTLTDLVLGPEQSSTLQAAVNKMDEQIKQLEEENAAYEKESLEQKQIPISFSSLVEELKVSRAPSSQNRKLSLLTPKKFNPYAPAFDPLKYHSNSLI